MKKFIKILTLTICFLMISAISFASEISDVKLIMSAPKITQNIDLNSIKVQLNGDFVDFTDSEGNIVEPKIINSRTMVPMRKIFEVLGTEIEWDGENRIVTGTKENVVIKLQIDNNVATKTIDGVTEEIILDTPPMLVNSRTMVPVRFIAESLDKKVGWDADNKTVIIIDTSFVEEKIKENASNFYEYLTLEKEVITTSESTSTLNAKIKYEDKEDSSNNTSLTINGDIEAKMKEKLVRVDFDISITGKGILIETIKEEGLKNIEGSIIFDIENLVTYINLSENIVGEELEDKWFKYISSEVDKENINMLLNISNSEDAINALVDSILGSELKVHSYDNLSATLDIICALCGDDKFSVSGRNSKKFEYTLELEDVLDLLNATEEERKAFLDEYDLEITSSEKYADGIQNEALTTILFGMESDLEELNVEVEIESELENYNKKVKVNLPNEEDIVEL